jgi:diacylglycerol kinase
LITEDKVFFRTFSVYKKQIRIIKDLSAAAVLVAAMIAILIGCIIFIPKIIAILGYRFSV